MSRKIAGYHAVKIVGWGETDVDPTLKYCECAAAAAARPRAWRLTPGLLGAGTVQNSWGPHWGESGYFNMVRPTRAHPWQGASSASPALMPAAFAGDGLRRRAEPDPQFVRRRPPGRRRAAGLHTRLSPEAAAKCMSSLAAHAP